MPEQRTPAVAPSFSLLGGGGHIKTITAHWQLSPIPAAELGSSFKQAQQKPLQRDGILKKLWREKHES